MPKKFKFGGGNKCLVCGKTVYVQEQVTYEGKFLHEDCFKCSICNKKIATASQAGSMDGYVRSLSTLTLVWAAHTHGEGEQQKQKRAREGERQRQRQRESESASERVRCKPVRPALTRALKVCRARVCS